MSSTLTKFFFLNLIVASFVLGGCAKKSSESGAPDPVPHTGSDLFEGDQTDETVEELELLDSEEATASFTGLRKYVYGDRLRVRSSPDTASLDNVVGVLSLNDEVMIVEPTLIGPDNFVRIEIVATESQIANAAAYYVSANFLSDKKAAKRKQQSKSPYYMIQNIATEKMRVYKKECDSGSCQHLLVLETDMVSGENKKGTRTNIGSYNITKWYKFYQDNAASYPSWYHPSYPPVPRPDAGVLKWTKKKVLPNGRGHVRGAFGWYTAHVGPNSHYQWTHGTIGWGADKKKFIKKTRSWFANLVTDPRSHGCSRTDNESIAYIRSLLPVGTPLVKVYAVEGFADPHLSRYSQEMKTWDYILTKNGSQRDGELAGRETVIANGTSASDYIEQGTYEIDAYPDLKAYKDKGSGKKSKNGNVYKVSANQMRGVFLVDEGRLVNYRRPSSVGKGGYRDQELPSFMVAPEGTSYVLPKVTRKSLGQ